jgi:spoIIIJ-associated protein
MKKEFFGSDVGQALEKAEQKLGISAGEISYSEVTGEILSASKEVSTAILVEFDDKTEKKPKQTLDLTEEEKKAQAAGGVEWAVKVCDGIFQRMGIETKTVAKERDNDFLLVVEVLSEQLDLRRGDSRELRGAIQHLVNRAANNGESEEKKFVVDLGGTLERRTVTMKEIAQELTDKVKDIGKPIHIHLMDSQDRRIIHVSLVADETIATQSRGDKQFRILSIEPKKEQ